MSEWEGGVSLYVGVREDRGEPCTSVENLLVVQRVVEDDTLLSSEVHSRNNE